MWLSKRNMRARGRSPWGWLVGAVLVVFVAFWFFPGRPSLVTPLRQSFQRFPRQIGMWLGEDGGGRANPLRLSCGAEDFHKQYTGADGRAVWLSVCYWAAQGRHGRATRVSFFADGWTAVEHGREVIPIDGTPGLIEVNRVVVRKDAIQWLISYWYEAQGRAVASGIAAAVRLVGGALIQRRTDGAVIVIASPLVGAPADVFPHQVRYIQAMYPILRQHLPPPER